MMEVMIAGIRGKVVDTGKGYVTLDVQGVFYRVFTTEATVSTLTPNEEATMLTYLSVRENSLELFGFLLETERMFFELLLEVPGIGPRSALNVLSLADVATLREAISSKNAGYLTKVSGIGKKSAEKIVITLQDKVEKMESAFDMSGETDALEALQALGYSPREAREALQQIPRDVESTRDRIRDALRILGK